MNCVSDAAMVISMPFDCSPRTSTGYTATREVASSDEVARMSSSKLRTLRKGSSEAGSGSMSTGKLPDSQIRFLRPG